MGYFELWLEFEHYKAKPDDDPTDDFINITVRLPDGRKYALNVWTFKYLQRAQYEEGEGEKAEYLLPPDLFVERLERPLIERVVRQMLAKHEMRDEWLCLPEKADTSLDSE